MHRRLCRCDHADVAVAPRRGLGRKVDLREEFFVELAVQLRLALELMQLDLIAHLLRLFALKLLQRALQRIHTRLRDLLVVA